MKRSLVDESKLDNLMSQVALVIKAAELTIGITYDLLEDLREAYDEVRRNRQSENTESFARTTRFDAFGNEVHGWKQR